MYYNREPQYVSLMGKSWYYGFLNRHQGIAEALETGLVEGVPFKLILDRGIRVGDTYLAERNAGLKLLTAAGIDPEGWVYPVEIAYCYDCGECIPIELLI